MGSLEAWLLLRSLRTLHLRVPRQSATATTLALWLNAVASTPVGQSYDGVPGGILSKVWHSSLQVKDSRGFQPSKQMEGGWNATFAVLVSLPILKICDHEMNVVNQFSRPEYAVHFPYLLKFFIVS